MNRAVFIDKDGTLVEDVPYNVDPARIRITEGAIEGLKLLKAEGFLLILISNQSGVARGYFSLDELGGVRHKINEMLEAEGVSFDAMYFCPHHPQGVISEFAIHCNCRKPEPGMILKAAHDFDIVLSASWMIGDILHDVEAGNRAGCRTLLINNGNETEWEINADRTPTALVSDLQEAASYIINAESYEYLTPIHTRNY
jgi:D-glycero-D-manno-heptose 1,7-bisphosphate phosphatase